MRKTSVCRQTLFESAVGGGMEKASAGEDVVAVGHSSL